MGKHDKAQDNLTTAKSIAEEINISAESLLGRLINEAELFQKK